MYQKVFTCLFMLITCLCFMLTILILQGNICKDNNSKKVIHGKNIMREMTRVKGGANQTIQKD